MNGANLGLRLTAEPPVATLWLDRSEKRNAMTLEMWVRLADLVDDFERDRALKVLVVRSAGTSTFCAGADLEEVRTMRRDATGTSTFDRTIAVSLETLRRCRKATIACVQGGCVGGGVEIVLACDLVLASRGASFTLSTTGLGIVYPYSSTRRLVQGIGVANSRFMLLTGRPLPAEDALRAGLVSGLCEEDDELVTAAYELATDVSARSMSAISATKAIVSLIERESHGLDVAAAEAEAAEIEAAAIRTGDYAEGLAAFRDGRAPRFTDR